MFKNREDFREFIAKIEPQIKEIAKASHELEDKAFTIWISKDWVSLDSRFEDENAGALRYEYDDGKVIRVERLEYKGEEI